jgi:hypothetical protein
MLTFEYRRRFFYLARMSYLDVDSSSLDFEIQSSELEGTVRPRCIHRPSTGACDLLLTTSPGFTVISRPRGLFK